MKKLWMVLGVVLIFGLVACQKPAEEKPAPKEEAPVAEEKAAPEEAPVAEEEAATIASPAVEGEAPAGEEVAMVSPEVAAGKALFNDASLGTSGKTCNSCHADGEGLAGAAAKHTEEGALAGVINNCIEKPLKGKALDKDSEQMKQLSAYVSSL